jgi:3',5'-cyclic AMP phosphodiesterase CpdA
MVNRGTDEGDWQKFFSVAGALLSHTAFYPAMGNHDQGAISGSERRFADVFALPARPDDCPPGAGWYSFDVSGVHVTVLDSNRYSDDKQLAWLDADLVRARASGARALFAIVHHGPYARGPHGGDPMAVARYVPVLVKRGVAVLFSGHDHIYQRGKKDGLTYVVTGGAGASLYPITCGVPGRPRCKTEDGAAIVMSAYHYLLVEVLRDDLRMCAKRPDGSLLEACVVLKLPQGQ